MMLPNLIATSLLLAASISAHSHADHLPARLANQSSSEIHSHTPSEYVATPSANSTAWEAATTSSALRAPPTPPISAHSTLPPRESTSVQALFSRQTTSVSATAGDGAAADDDAAAPFVMPGTRIRIFPVGAVVTGVWAAALVGVVGWGTVGRVGFRGSYRRGVARAARAAGRRG